MKQDAVATSPKAMTVFGLLLTLPCGVASGERSFSVLKRVKSQLGSNSVTSTHSSLMPNDSQQLFDVLIICDSKKIIRNFAAACCRRKTSASRTKGRW